MTAPGRRTVLGLMLASLVLNGVQPLQAAPRTLKIGMIGAGEVASTLGALWMKAGYQVMFSSRHPAEAHSIAQQLGALATSGTPEQAAAFGDVVLLAVPYSQIPALGPILDSMLRGKILLDATNPYSFRDGAIAGTAAQTGAGTLTQSYFPHVHVVRGFNSIDMTTLQMEANRPPPLLGIPIAGDDAQALETVSGLVSAAGFDPVVTGDLAS